jgi:hypothetical protein
MKPGDVVTANLVDTLRHQALGGQENTIASTPPAQVAKRGSAAVANAVS